MPFDGEAMRFGDIVLVPFPFTDQSAVKRRPAVIISSSDYNERHADRIMMPVTSQMRGDDRPDDIVVDQWQAAHLLKPSAIKPLIATIEASLIIRKLGSLVDSDTDRLRAALGKILAW